MHYLTVIKAYETSRVRFINTDNLEKHIEYLKECEEDVIAYYPLEDSLEPIGKLIEDSLSASGKYLGGQMEELLTKLVQDIFKKGFDDAVEKYGIQEEEG
ncbi:MAG: hypothetical protein ACD_7C00140G0008 [uncultured bacterium]|nr:MAG: hypothetical protein ACD_7C00140G0008 [uncultured bacterium]HBR79057.1 hypothetical protein [Candidatus Moranbacteria bacterium]